MNAQFRLLLPVTVLGLIVLAGSAQQFHAPPKAPDAASTNSHRPHHRGIDPAARARTTAIDAGDRSPEAMKVLVLERNIAAAVVRGDVSYVSGKLADGFIMVHGDTWVTGKPIILADNKASFLKRVENRQYVAREISTSKVEIHSNVALTFGQYIAENKPGGTTRSWFSVWYERVFAKRGGQWVMLSHRTISGPHYGPDRNSVK